MPYSVNDNGKEHAAGPHHVMQAVILHMSNDSSFCFLPQSVAESTILRSKTTGPEWGKGGGEGNSSVSSLA